MPFPSSDRPVFVIGFMGTGKSTVGRLLAARLSRPFVDLDERIEERALQTIPEIFAAEGEPGFRAREAEELARTFTEGAQVIAVGGGAPAFGDNLERMLAAGVVVCLTASVEEILVRVGDGAGRPLLQRAADRAAEVTRLLHVRAPSYARAHLTIDTTRVAPSHVVARLAEELA